MPTVRDIAPKRAGRDDLALGAVMPATPHHGRPGQPIETCAPFCRDGGRASLFPSSDRRRRWEDFLDVELARVCERIARGPVTPAIDYERALQALREFDFNTQRPLDEVLTWAIGQLEHGVTHFTHPRYFGLFNPAPTFPAQCADRIAAALNPQLATSTTSPAAVAIEEHVIRMVAARAGLPPQTSGGHFTTGGTEANCTALNCALTRAHAGFAGEGARAFPGQPVFYISSDSHLAWLKIAHQAGIGREAARLIATDGAGRLDLLELSNTITDDLSTGRVPVMIAATAGTTNAGMIDPLAACAAIARDSGLWYHVDAAWGGAAIASEHLRPLLAGIEQADSITIDAHKWFATTMGCGMFLIRNAALLSSVFHVAAHYMPSNVRGLDPYVTSGQWSRRFLGLRLFLSLAAAGWSGYAEHVERSVALATRLADKLAMRGWRIVNEPSLAVLSLEPPPGSGDVRSIVERVLVAGQAWISVARFEGRPVIRACVTNGETLPEDLDMLVEELEAAR
jgi:aromatic-L-amino-acid decarboxylase